MLAICRDLMPSGKPDFLSMQKYQTVASLAKSEGNVVMLKVLMLLVKDFCNSLNVVRNMNDDQMIEAASMLLDECGNFRLEDYVMMFAMAKRGDLVKIYDRLDIEIITKILNEYWGRRNIAGESAQAEDVQHLDSLGNNSTQKDLMHPMDLKMLNATDGLAYALDSLKSIMTKDIL